MQNVGFLMTWLNCMLIIGVPDAVSCIFKDKSRDNLNEFILDILKQNYPYFDISIVQSVSSE